MNFEEIGRVWRDAETGDFMRRRIDTLSTARNRATALRRRVKRRDAVETVAALIVIPFLIAGFFVATTPVSAAGAILGLIACIFIPIRIRMARRPAPETTVPVTEAVRLELDHLRSQERLLATVPVWYVAPLVGAMLLFIGGLSVSRLGDPVSWAVRLRYMALPVMVSVLVVVMNRKAAERLRPLTREMESWLEALEDSQTGDEA